MSKQPFDYSMRFRIKYDIDRDAYFVFIYATINGDAYIAEAKFELRKFEDQLVYTSPEVLYPPTDKSSS